MSDLYGPPLKFKAVNPETGAESESFNISPDKTWADARLEGNVDFADYASAVYCQSTGLKDAAGKEVFWGDVIHHPTWGFYELWSWKYLRAEFRSLENPFRLLGSNALEKAVLVGNRWQPREVLEARAREVVGNV